MTPAKKISDEAHRKRMVKRRQHVQALLSGLTGMKPHPTKEGKVIRGFTQRPSQRVLPNISAPHPDSLLSFGPGTRAALDLHIAEKAKRQNLPDRVPGQRLSPQSTRGGY